MQTQRFQNLQTTSLSQLKPAPGLASPSAVKEQPLPSFTTTAERPTAKRSRRKLWDIPEKLLCPVIGTCLELGELRRIAAKARLESHHSMSEYDLHVNCVSAARDKNSLSIATQKVLEKKYATTVRRFSKAKDEEAVMAIWTESVARGDVPGGLWALTTHPQAGEQALYDAYGEVHMLSHQIGAGQRADLKELAETRAELFSLRCLHEQAVHRAQHQVEQRERRIQALETRLSQNTGLQAKLSALQSRLDSLNSGRELNELRQRLHELESRFVDLEQRHLRARKQSQEWRERSHTMESRASRLETELADRAVECSALERLITADITSDCSDCEVKECHARPDLGGRRVLCVGGRSTLAHQYRALVARCNGKFDRHDGGLEDNRQRLEAMLATADAVVCPTDCVSHDAYYRVKRFCKRVGKPCVLLQSSGVSAFARAITIVADLGEEKSSVRSLSMPAVSTPTFKKN